MKKMVAQRKFQSLKNQIVACLGFLVLFLGLLLHFFSEKYSMLRDFRNLFILVDCLGCSIVILAISLAFITNRSNSKETWKPLFIESSLTVAFNLSLQAVTFHLLFTNSLSPVNLGVFFTFVAFCLAIVTLIYSVISSLFKRYSVILLIVGVFVLAGTLTSGIFLTFTGSIDPITENGIGLLSLGITSVFFVIIFSLFSPKLKRLNSEDDKGKDDGENEEEQIKAEV